MVSVTLKEEIIFAEDALRKAKRDLDREERTARLYDDPIEYSPALRRALKIATEKHQKAERKLQRLLKRKGNPMPKRKASPAQLRALARGRGIRKAKLKRSTVKKKAAPKRKARRRNPLDPALMRARALKSDLKAGKGWAKNPPHYVIKVLGKPKYFDGAGWASTTNSAAQYTTKAKAAAIGTKVANATDKTVQVVPV